MSGEELSEEALAELLEAIWPKILKRVVHAYLAVPL